MNTYLKTLENDINAVRDLSHVCRGEWCRFVESDADTLQNELIEFKISEGNFERSLVQEMSSKLRDAYRHMMPHLPFNHGD